MSLTLPSKSLQIYPYRISFHRRCIVWQWKCSKIQNTVAVGVCYLSRWTLRTQSRNSNFYHEKGGIRFFRNACTSVPKDRASHAGRPLFYIVVCALTFLLTPISSSTFYTLLQHRRFSRRNPFWSLNKVHFAAALVSVLERYVLRYCWPMLSVQKHSSAEIAGL
jgi:hypothetical protein